MCLREGPDKAIAEEHRMICTEPLARTPDVNGIVERVL